MKTYILILISLIFTLPIFAEDSKRLADDVAALESVKSVFIKTASEGNQFGKDFWIHCKAVADKRGPEITRAVMEISAKWKGQEGLIYVPLVALLERKPTEKILQDYIENGTDSEKIWANEFVTEFEMSDTKKGVEKFSKTKD